MTSADARFGTGKVTLPSDREILISARSTRRQAWCSTRGRRRASFGGGGAGVPCHSSSATSTFASAASGTTRWSGQDGERISWRGTYLAVDPPHQLRSTEIFDGQAESEAQNTLTLTERHGVTELAIPRGAHEPRRTGIDTWNPAWRLGSSAR